jgi:hypothetical protein
MNFRARLWGEDHRPPAVDESVDERVDDWADAVENVELSVDGRKKSKNEAETPCVEGI